MKAIIISNGEIKNYSYYKKYFEGPVFIVCCDGGARHLRNLSVIPDVLLGDFDSISEEDLKYCKENSVETIKYPVKKDKTDTEIAVEYVISKKCDSCTIIGGFGNRADHTLANILLLIKMLKKGVLGTIIDEKNSINVIQDKTRIEKIENHIISLIPITEEVRGITTKGLLYPLNNATIMPGDTRGISNEFSADMAEIDIKSGMLLIIISEE